MQKGRVLSFIEKAVEMKSNVIFFDDIANTDNFRLYYRGRDHRLTEVETHENFSEVLAVVREMMKDPAFLPLPDELDFIDAVISETLSGYCVTLNLIPKVPEIKDISSVSYLQNYGYTEKQAHDIVKIYENKTGFILMSSNIVETRRTYNALAKCVKHDMPDVRFVFVNQPQENLRELAEKSLVFCWSHGHYSFRLPYSFSSFAHSCSDGPFYPLIRGIIFQRECPVLCEKCKIPLEKKSSSPEFEDLTKYMTTTLDEIVAKKPETKIYFRGSGCDTCQQTGIQEKSFIAEVLPFLDEYADIYKNDKNAADIVREKFVAEGGELFEDIAFQKMKNGMLSPVKYENLCSEVTPASEVFRRLFLELD